MTNQPQISTLLALQTVRDYGAESEFYKTAVQSSVEPRSVYQILAELSERSPKQAWRTLEKLIRKEWVAQGSSPRVVWLTDAGKYRLLQLENPEKYAVPSVTAGFTYAEKSWSRKHAPAVVRVSDKKPEHCSHCGSEPVLRRVGLPFFSTRKQYRCTCGVAGPVVVFHSWDNSSPFRMATRLWNCVMLGVKVYGHRNEPHDTPFRPDN